MGTPSLAALVEKLLGTRLTKGDRLTDWTRRPLHVDQRVYAAADVEYLLALHDVLVARLEPMGRLEWATDECEERRQRIRTRPEPDVAWWRIKGARQLRGPVARRRAAGRRRGASAPPRRSTSRPASCSPTSRSSGIVQRPPRTREELDRDPRRRRPSCATARRDDLLAAITAGLELDRRRCAMPESDHIDRSLAPAVTVIGAWLAQRGVGARSRPGRARDPRRAHPAAARRARAGSRPVGAPTSSARRCKRLLAGEATIVLRDGGRRIELRDQ